MSTMPLHSSEKAVVGYFLRSPDLRKSFLGIKVPAEITGASVDKGMDYAQSIAAVEKLPPDVVRSFANQLIGAQGSFDPSHWAAKGFVSSANNMRTYNAAASGVVKAQPRPTDMPKRATTPVASDSVSKLKPTPVAQTRVAPAGQQPAASTDRPWSLKNYTMPTSPTQRAAFVAPRTPTAMPAQPPMPQGLIGANMAPQFGAPATPAQPAPPRPAPVAPAAPAPARAAAVPVQAAQGGMTMDRFQTINPYYAQQ
jgi:hypothetical protein